MEPVTLAPFGAINNGYVHATTGIIGYGARDMDDILIANGALVVEFNPSTGAEIAWGWAVGRDLIDICRTNISPAVVAARIIQRDTYTAGVYLGEVATDATPQYHFQRHPGPVNTADYEKRAIKPPASEYRILCVRNRCYAGYGSGKPSGAWGGLAQTATLAAQYPHSALAITRVGASPIVGAVRVRLPGGKTWEERAAQYFTAVEADLPSGVSGFPQVKNAALQRARELSEALAYQRNSTLDVFPILTLQASGPRLVPPTPKHVIGASGLVGQHEWGLTTWDAEYNAYSTIVPAWPENPMQSCVCNSVANPLTNAVTTPAACLAKLETYPVVKSVDGIPIAAILGGLCGTLFESSITSEQAIDLTSPGAWETNRTAMAITDGPPPAVRANDEYGAPVSEAVYYGALSTQVAAIKDSGARRILTTNWDHGNGGLSEFIAIFEMSLNADKAKAWETSMFGVRSLRGQSDVNRYSSSDWKTGPLFADSSSSLTSLMGM